MNDTLFPAAFPASWASEWGQDRFGLYMDLNCQGVCQRFRWMLPGSFMMGSPGLLLSGSFLLDSPESVLSGSFLPGSPENEAKREFDETLHPVTLTRGFWLADTACTQALWQAVMNENPSHFTGPPDLPVENVSWNDVQQFIERLNALFPELRARLPTEAQWEYACSAGTQTPFAFGDNVTPEQVNYDGNYPYAGVGKGLYREKTVPVKSLPPNPWGLYQMHGNVWEWCADWYGDYHREAVIDPLGPGQGEHRVVRGGSWHDDAWDARSADRYRDRLGYRDDDLGFRLALG